jgi:hypothetical protein
VLAAAALPKRSPTSTPPNALVPAWAEHLVHWLDRAFVIPGTQIPIGFDALLGFIAPGAGDAVGALATFAIVYLGFKLRVPKVILLRMLLNIGIDALVGSVPFLGDVFDVGFRAAERNLDLVRRHGGRSRTPPGFGDYLVVALAIAMVVLLLLLPLAVGVLLVHVAVRLGEGL